MAGETTRYSHLTADHVPTIGQLMSAASVTAEALSRVAGPGSPEVYPGEWTRAPETVGCRSGIRVMAVVLRSSEFAPLPVSDRGRAGSGTVTCLARGKAHVAAVSSAGRLRTVHGLTALRSLAVAPQDEHQVINTGAEPALVVAAVS